jgi:hypothetical protein
MTQDLSNSAVSPSEAIIEAAKAVGIDMSDSYHVSCLLISLRVCDERFKIPRLKNWKGVVSDRLNIPVEDIDLLMQHGWIAKASQIAGTMQLRQMLDREARAQQLQVFHDQNLEWISNMGRIAAGKPHPKTGKPPLDRDSVAAYQALNDSPTGKVYAQMVFLPERDTSQAELLHLEEGDKLSKSAIIKLE